MLEVVTGIEGLIFEPLNSKNHDRLCFDCGVEKLNCFLNQYASQQQIKNLTMVHVATNGSLVKLKPIYGYYSLSASAIEFKVLPKELVQRVPQNYIIPSVKIGRLARDVNRTKKGFGVLLLAHALGKILRISKDVAIFVIDIDAKNKELAEYYKQYGFVELLDCQGSLVMPLATLDITLKILQKSEQMESAVN